MRRIKYILILNFSWLSVNLSAQDTENKFIGRIYITEQADAFFQFVSKDSAHYYGRNDVGVEVISKQNANWEIINDSTIKLTILYYPRFSNEVFNLNYKKEQDYWIENADMFVFRRVKQLKFGDFFIKEF